MADNIRDQGHALRAETAEAIEACIVRLERERRDPDQHESGCLIRAIVWFSEGKFIEAMVDVDRAQKPVAMRRGHPSGKTSSSKKAVGAEAPGVDESVGPRCCRAQGW
jgi:hypothetical protein